MPKYVLHSAVSQSADQSHMGIFKFSVLSKLHIDERKVYWATCKQRLHKALVLVTSKALFREGRELFEQRLVDFGEVEA